MVNLYVNSHFNKKEVKLPRGETGKADRRRVLPRPPMGPGQGTHTSSSHSSPFTSFSGHPTSPHCVRRAFPVAQCLRLGLPVQETQEMWVQSLGGKDPLEKEMATHSSIPEWEIPWAEEPGGLQSIGLQRVGHD